MITCNSYRTNSIDSSLKQAKTLLIEREREFNIKPIKNAANCGSALRLSKSSFFMKSQPPNEMNIEESQPDQAIPKIDKLNKKKHKKVQTFIDTNKNKNSFNININIFSNTNIVTNKVDKDTLNDTLLTTNTLNIKPKMTTNSNEDTNPLSRRWKKLTNVIKAVKFLHRYDAVSIKEIDIEHNLNDYKERLLPNSPLLKRAKTRNLKQQQQPRKYTDFQAVKGDLATAFEKIKINERGTSNAVFNKCQLNLLDDSTILPSEKFIKRRPEPRNVMSDNLTMITPCKKQNSPGTKINDQIELIESSYFENSESIDDVQVEMNKISIIERIKNYILE